jgi:hypothetical protein
MKLKPVSEKYVVVEVHTTPREEEQIWGVYEVIAPDITSDMRRIFCWCNTFDNATHICALLNNELSKAR